MFNSVLSWINSLRWCYFYIFRMISHMATESKTWTTTTNSRIK